jgi:hypothetical protein
MYPLEFQNYKKQFIKSYGTAKYKLKVAPQGRSIFSPATSVFLELLVITSQALLSNRIGKDYLAMLCDLMEKPLPG